MPRTLLLALILAALLAPASLLAADLLTGVEAEQEEVRVNTKNAVNPRNTTPFPGPVTTQQGQAVVDKLKKAADAQGEISPYTLKALERDPKAMEVLGRAPSGNSGGQPAPQANPGAGPKSTKAMYGDIIIHK